MTTDNDDRLALGDDGEFTNVLRTVVEEICREEPGEAAVKRVVCRALRIRDANTHPKR